MVLDEEYIRQMIGQSPDSHLSEITATGVSEIPYL